MNLQLKLVTVFIICLWLHGIHSKEMKGKNRLTLCGGTFYQMLKYCCATGCPVAGKREILHRRRGKVTRFGDLARDEDCFERLWQLL